VGRGVTVVSLRVVRRSLTNDRETDLAKLFRPSLINQAIANKDMDIWGDQAFNESAWAGPSRKSTHDRIAQVLAGCMSWAGFPTYANEKKVPTLPVQPGVQP